MDNADRETIEVNINDLIKATDYKTLRDCCLEGNIILFSEMSDKIEVRKNVLGIKDRSSILLC